MCVSRSNHVLQTWWPRHDLCIDSFGVEYPPSAMVMERAVMSAHASDKPATIVPFAPMSKGQREANIVADDSGRTIVALLQKAAEMAKDDCARAMDLAHKLSLELRAAEERARQLEVEAAHFRDRAARAEAWLVRIHNEVEHTFFQKKDQAPRQPSGQ
jgi:hypothetical protein